MGTFWLCSTYDIDFSDFLDYARLRFRKAGSIYVPTRFDRYFVLLAKNGYFFDHQTIIK